MYDEKYLLVGEMRRAGMRIRKVIYLLSRVETATRCASGWRKSCISRNGHGHMDVKRREEEREKAKR